MSAPTFSYWNDEDQARFDAERKRGGNTSALKPALWSLIVVATLSLVICAGAAASWAWRMHNADVAAEKARDCAGAISLQHAIELRKDAFENYGEQERFWAENVRERCK